MHNIRMTLESPLARRDVILGRLAQGQSVVAAALALEFEVSEDAIRRDLRALAAEGRCRRVYGGALPLSKAMAPMAARMEEARDRKQALARKAASLVSRDNSFRRRRQHQSSARLLPAGGLRTNDCDEFDRHRRRCPAAV